MKCKIKKSKYRDTFELMRCEINDNKFFEYAKDSDHYIIRLVVY